MLWSDYQKLYSRVNNLKQLVALGFLQTLQLLFRPIQERVVDTKLHTYSYTSLKKWLYFC